MTRFPLLLAVAMTGLMMMGMQDAQAVIGSPGKQVSVPLGTNGAPFGYLEYLPQDFTPTKKYPLVLFLHGLGEKGSGSVTDLNKVKVNEPTKFLADGSKHLPAIVISPQTADWWNPTKVKNFVDYILIKYPMVDPDRVYLTGLSMGGDPTWQTPVIFPGVFAAIVPICGAINYVTKVPIGALQDTPIWAFHAYDDTVVPPGKTTGVLSRITPPETDSVTTGYVKGADRFMSYSYSAGTHSWVSGNTSKEISVDTRIRMTMYATGGHNSWLRAYRNDDMWNWLFSWKKGGVLIGAEPEPQPEPEPEPLPPEPVLEPGTIKIDFGSGKVALPTGWNNAGAAVKSNDIVLKNDKGVVTDVHLVTVSSLKRVNVNGTKTADVALGIPAGASQDSFFGVMTTHGGISEPVISYELRGLDPTRSYTFEFFASRLGVNDNRTTKYTLTNGTSSVTTSLNVANNVNLKAVTAPIKPSADGRLRLEATRGDGNNNVRGYFYLGNVVVKY